MAGLVPRPFSRFDDAAFAFAQWKPYTSPEGRSGWISTGGVVRYSKPGTADATDTPDATGQTDHTRGQRFLVEGLAGAIPESVRNDPGTLERIKDRALTVAAVAYSHLVRATPLVHRFLSTLPDLLDEPGDLRKLGYAPMALGSATAEQIAAADPVRAHLGISTHMALSIASHVLGRLFVLAKHRLGGASKTAEVSTFADSTDEIATWVSGLLTLVTRELHLPEPDPKAVTAAVGALVGGGRVSMSAQSPLPTVGKAQERSHNAQLPVAGVSQTALAHGEGEPASPEVALAGKDGEALARLIRKTKAAGVKFLSQLTRDAVKRYRGLGPLFDATEEKRIAQSLATLNTTAELLGRSRVREMAERVAVAGDLSRFAEHDVPLSTFADGPGVIETPQAAVDYFVTLVPKLGIDPERLEDEQRRRAFTLAKSTNEALTSRVQKIIAEGLAENRSAADVTADITGALDAIGTSKRNPQYAEMVYRTNAMDAFQTGVYEEGRHPDVAGLFPVWQYLGIDDERAGEDHRPKFGKFFDAAVPFALARGNRPYNCRCSMRWVDTYEWDDLYGRGARVEIVQRANA